jgi:hypothetical protein
LLQCTSTRNAWQTETTSKNTSGTLKPHAFSVPQNRKVATSYVDDVVPARACRKIQPPVTLAGPGYASRRTGDRSRCPVTVLRQPVGDGALARMFRLCAMKLLFSRRSSLVCHAMPCMEGIQEKRARLVWACEQVTAFYFDVVCPATAVKGASRAPIGVRKGWPVLWECFLGRARDGRGMDFLLDHRQPAVGNREPSLQQALWFDNRGLRVFS